MIAALLLSFACVQDTSATFRVEPEAVEVGEPFALVLELEHAATTSVWALTETELALDDSLVAFGEEDVTVEELSEGRRRTRKAWRLASLEPGPRSLAEALPVLPDVARVSASGATIDVRSVLGEDEDAPRPAHGFPDGFGSAAPAEERAAWPLVLGAVLALVAAGLPLWLWFRRRSTGGEDAPAPDPLTQLAALEAAPAESPLVVCERHFALTRLVRGAVDEAEGRTRPGLTDSEWLATVRGTSLFTDDLADLLARAEEVKYGGRVPTRWALDEAFTAARGALAGIFANDERREVRS